MTLADGAAQRIAARFAGRLYPITLTRMADDAIDPTDPHAEPSGSDTTHSGEGYSFEYNFADIDGTRILASDFRVLILRSLTTLPQDGDLISIQPPGEATPRTGTVIAIEAVTEAFTTCQVRGS